MCSEKLSSDMILEILSRTSLETLDACKIVCNQWNRFINEWSFMPNYCDRTNNLYGYILQDFTRNKHVSQFVSIGHSKGSWQWSNHTSIHNLPLILASSNHGILCCLKSFPNRLCRYYVCKPSTKQCQSLPNPKTRYQTNAIGIMVLPSDADYLRYKIVRVSHRDNLRYTDKRGSAYTVEVFDSRVWSWSVKQDLFLPYGEIIISCPGGPAVELNRSLHWLTSENNVLVFCTLSNSFNKFSLPKEDAICNPYSYNKLLEYQGKLGVMSQSIERDIELWVMEDDNTWVKKLSFNIDTEVGEHVERPGLEGFYNAEIAFLQGYGVAAFHKLQHGSYGIVKLDEMISPREVFTFRSDLEPVNLRPRIELVSRKRRAILSLASIGIKLLGVIALFLFLIKLCL